MKSRAPSQRQAEFLSGTVANNLLPTRFWNVMTKP